MIEEPRGRHLLPTFGWATEGFDRKPVRRRHIIIVFRCRRLSELEPAARTRLLRNRTTYGA
jgi:hypothetical protein